MERVSIDHLGSEQRDKKGVSETGDRPAIPFRIEHKSNLEGMEDRVYGVPRLRKERS